MQKNQNKKSANYQKRIKNTFVSNNKQFDNRLCQASNPRGDRPKGTWYGHNLVSDLRSGIKLGKWQHALRLFTRIWTACRMIVEMKPTGMEKWPPWNVVYWQKSKKMKRKRAWVSLTIDFSRILLATCFTKPTFLSWNKTQVMHSVVMQNEYIVTNNYNDLKTSTLYV